MAESCDVGTEAREDRALYAAGLQLPPSPLCTPESAARALTMRPLPGDLVLSSYPRCDSPWVELILWSLLYPDLEWPPFDTDTGRFLSCLEMEGDAHLAHDRQPRLYKTYFPFRLIPFYRRVKYVYVIRSPWEACSAHFRFLRSSGSLAPGATFDQFFGDFLEGDVAYGSYFRHVAPWNRRAGDANVLVLCREQVEHNPRSALFKVAAFLGERYLSLLMDDEDLERRILRGGEDLLGWCRPASERKGRGFEDCFSEEVDVSSRGPSCNERQLEEIVRRVSQHFGNSSIEFLWLNQFQKQLPVLAR